MTFKVLVADNFHYGDENETYCGGEFKTIDIAIQFCKNNVDEYLDSAYEKGMSEEALFSSYSSFGDDPYIVSYNTVSDNTVSDNFSAWDYARERCREICCQDAKITS